MNDSKPDEDPDPLRPSRTGALFVPVRPGPGGHCARLFRTPLGVRTAVAFTHERQLTLTLGQRQPWIRLSMRRYAPSSRRWGSSASSSTHCSPYRGPMPPPPS